MGSNSFRLEDRSADWGEKIWTLTFDLAGEKVNKFSQEVMDEFEPLLAELETKGKAKEISALVLLSGKPNIFIAGADIKLIENAKTKEEASGLSATGQELLNRWEDLPFTTVAAIHGAALGGGCEISLACDAIIMSNDKSSKIGLPEIMLGVIPGMGGCVRLSGRIGFANSLDMILSSKQLDGKRAQKMGLIEAVLPFENWHHTAQHWVSMNLKKLKSGKSMRRKAKLGGMGGVLGWLLEGPFKGVVFSQARKTVLKRTRGQYPAPLEAIKVIKKVGTPYGKRLRGRVRAKAMAVEAAGFGVTAETSISKNLIGLFFMTEEVKKSNGLAPGSTLTIPPLRTAGVLGAGTMGGGIAQLFAQKGITAVMKDLTKEALETGIHAANGLFKKQLKRRRINRREYLQKLNLISPTTDYLGFKRTDLVVEAIVENMDIKKKVLVELEENLPSNTVIASNTSSLSISEMATPLKRPENFVGMHFFNPVHRMPLIEVIRGEKTSDEAVAVVFEASKKLGKTPVVVKDAPGFLVNRLLLPYMNESCFVLADGLPIEEIDRHLLKFGMPMGPMELIDEVGVDVGAKVAKILYEAFGDRMLPSPLTDSVTQSGRLGKKNKKGLYDYSSGKKVLDSKIYSLVGITPKAGAVSYDETIERTIYPMINEGARCLDEGIVASAAELDLAMIMGTGFPPFKGGLMKFADSVGVKTIVERLEHHSTRFGARYQPSDAIKKRAAENRPFYS